MTTLPTLLSRPPADGTRRVIKRPHRIPRTKHTAPEMTEVKAKFPEVKFQQVQEVLKHHGKKGSVIDVREPQELIEDGRIKGFINIPLKDVQQAFSMRPEEFKLHYNADKPDPKKDVIFSCRSGRRAVMAAEKLQELGTYHKIKVYPGSFQDWVLHNGEFTQGPEKRPEGTGDAKKEEEDERAGSDADD
ncbi:rhodanese domain-containing protein CG4456-like isoform X1 [Dermacentor andersoni]|uniref:rhodanese domain-containing protein CG4456-like isoform X1 n=2 Tax=Dermacentor andersoni TaxID=34620 RepID=UPI0024178DB3|nr:rhodanese domain-containing protein CG4456-like isoform X1 [Dermacentor andersoni]